MERPCGKGTANMNKSTMNETNIEVTPDITRNQGEQRDAVERELTDPTLMDANACEPIKEEKDNRGFLTPLSDIVEKKMEFHIIANLSGVQEEDLDISVEKNVLVIDGKITGGNHMAKYSSYKRDFKLGDEIDVDGIKATFDDGILYLVLPKNAEGEPEKVHISIN